MSQFNQYRLEHLSNARFLVFIDRYPERGQGDDGLFGVQFAYDVPQEQQFRTRVNSDVLGLMGLPEAKALRRTLFDGAVEWAFADLDSTTRHWISHNMAPTEWHTELDAQDVEIMRRIKVFAADKPTVPAPPKEPSLGEVLAGAIGMAVVAGFASSIEHDTSSAESETEHPHTLDPKDRKENLAAYVRISLKEMEMGNKYWGLRSYLRDVQNLLHRGDTAKACTKIREMSWSKDPILSGWAKAIIRDVGIT